MHQRDFATDRKEFRSSGGPSYDELKIESAVLADVAHGEPNGTSIWALKAELPFGGGEVESAIERLQLLEAVHKEGEQNRPRARAGVAAGQRRDALWRDGASEEIGGP